MVGAFLEVVSNDQCGSTWYVYVFDVHVGIIFIAERGK